MHADAVGLELAFSKKVRLVFAEVIEPQLVRRSIKMPGELCHSVKVYSSCILAVVAGLESSSIILGKRVMRNSSDPHNAATVSQLLEQRPRTASAAASCFVHVGHNTSITVLNRNNLV